MLVFGLRTRVEKDIFLGVEHNLAFIVEIGLNKFVVQPEHDGLIGFDPFFDIYKGQIILGAMVGLVGGGLQIFSEILH